MNQFPLLVHRTFMVSSIKQGEKDFEFKLFDTKEDAQDYIKIIVWKGHINPKIIEHITSTLNGIHLHTSEYLSRKC